MADVMLSVVRRAAPFTLGAAAVVAVAAHAGAAAPAARQGAPVTFNRDVAPIVFAACATCHRPSGAAHFSLTSYDEVKGRAAQIAEATRTRAMPPWKPEPGYGRFVGERRLTDQQIAIIQRWVADGAPEGDPAVLPPLPAHAGRWQLGEPDMILQTPAYALRATGDDMYRNFVLPIPVKATRYIRAWEFLPGQSHAVHHATMQFDAAGAARRLDAADPEPGYEGLIPHSATGPEGYFLDWGPGHMPYTAPPGMAWPVRPNTDLVMMLHLRPPGHEAVVQGSIGLYFSDTPPATVPTLIRLTRQNLDIPAGDANHVVRSTFTLPVDVRVHTVQPHAHYLAREVSGYATLPDGSRQWLVFIRDWDFDWQGVYRYATPPLLPAGTVLTMEYRYDNSAANPRNPHTPPRRTRYGQRTSDEMAELVLQVVPVAAADRPRLVQASQEAILREEIVGYETMLEAEPGNVTLRNDVALLYVRSKDIAAAVRHFSAVVDVQPQSAAAHYNLGNALMLLRQTEAAVRHFDTAVALQPDYAPAHHGLGLVRQADPRTLPQAAAHLQRAVQLAPDNAEIRHHFAVTLRRLGRLSEAVREYREVLRIDPGRSGAAGELAAAQRELAAAAKAPGQ